MEKHISVLEEPLSSQEELDENIPVTLKAPRFNPRKGIVELTKYAATGGLTILSSAGTDLVAVSGAILSAGINPFANIDAKYAVTAVAVSYIPYATSLWKNADQCWQSLKETGVSVNIFAKLGYDLSRKFTQKKQLQKTATYCGFIGSQLPYEIPYLIGAFAGKEIMTDWVPEHYTPNMEYAFLAGANIFAAGFLYAQAGGIEAVLRGWRNRKRIVDMFKK
ncbi:MAG: hypothetical protein Q7R97_04165 [Candidatus Daviesbacteria bacterium]|nr:hypothetical protein [Candidatus Daviesbacteria bacterium]